MANNSISRPFGAITQTKWADVVAQTVFAGFLFLIFVGLEPFSSRDSVAMLLMSTGEGDTVRQICFILAFVGVAGWAFILRGQDVLKVFPLPLAVVLFWCLISVIWAVDPSIAARRLMLTAILAASVMAGVEMLGAQRSLRVLRFVLMIVLIVNLISVFIIPQAVHLPGELEAELAGNWRGLHYHKNIAGPVAALSALIFFHYALAMRRGRDWLLFLAAVVFMVGTQSKTAIGFFGISLLISSTYRFMGRSPMGRQLFRYIFVSVLVLSTIVWLAAYEAIADFMSDPTRLTGRVAIWQTVFAYLENNWLLGAGFGSFWQVGEISPALSVASQKWIKIVPHSHSGYIEILATTGVIGLFLAVVAFIIIPVKQILDPRRGDNELKALMLSLICFIIFSNLLETIFLNRDLPEWIVFMMLLAILRQMSVRGAYDSQLSLAGHQYRSRRRSYPYS